MTKEEIKEGVRRHGFYPTLMLLRTMEDEEEYETCKLIKEVIDETKGEKVWLSTKTDAKSLSITYHTIKSRTFDPDDVYSVTDTNLNEFSNYIDGLSVPF